MRITAGHNHHFPNRSNLYFSAALFFALVWTIPALSQKANTDGSALLKNGLDCVRIVPGKKIGCFGFQSKENADTPRLHLIDGKTAEEFGFTKKLAVTRSPWGRWTQSGQGYEIVHFLFNVDNGNASFKVPLAPGPHVLSVSYDHYVAYMSRTEIGGTATTSVTIKDVKFTAESGHVYTLNITWLPSRTWSPIVLDETDPKNPTLVSTDLGESSSASFTKF